MLTMTCDRCGDHIPYDKDEVRLSGRTRFVTTGGKDLIFDLCAVCSHIVIQDAVEYIESWTNAPIRTPSSRLNPT